MKDLHKASIELLNE